MRRKILVLCLLCPTGAYAADSCPVGYVAIEEPYIVIEKGDSCPTGYISVGTTTSCSSQSPGGECMIFNICPELPENAIWTDMETCAWTCIDGYGLTPNNTCEQMCTAGISQIKTNTGISVPLYATPQTAPAINVKYNDITCFGSLAAGESQGATNVNYNGTTYHTTN